MAGWKYFIGTPAAGWQNLSYDDSAWTPIARPSWGFGPSYDYTVAVTNGSFNLYGRLPITVTTGSFDTVAWIVNMRTTFYLEVGGSYLVQANYGTAETPGVFTKAVANGDHMVSFHCETYDTGVVNGILKLFFGVVPTLAPPCQNFPRDDRQGVGAGQNFPPPKTHQGGRANFGTW